MPVTSGQLNFALHKALPIAARFSHDQRTNISSWHMCAFREYGHSTLDDGLFHALGLLEERDGKLHPTLLGTFVAERAAQLLLSEARVA